MSACNFLGVRVALTFAILPSLLALDITHAQGGSAVITLVMPVGARQLGMGEAAVALADDVYGTYWNPSGLAFGPVANEWELMLPGTYRSGSATAHREFTAIATQPRSGFLLKSIVWAGTKNGLLYYDGKHWRDYHEVVMEEGDKIDAIVRRYVGTGDKIDSIVARVRQYNHIQTKQDEEDLVTLRIPYNLLFPDQPVTALALDNTDRLWVGTPVGLFRFDGQGWKAFNREEGFTYLPDTTAVREDSLTAKIDSTHPRPAVAAKSPFRQLAVTAIAVKGVSVWIGTEDGLYEYKKNAIIRRGENLLPSQYITSIGVHPDIDEMYVGLKDHGLARYRASKVSNAPAKWKLFGTADGLLDSNITQVVVDKYGHVYTSHAGGVSHFSLRSWEKLHFRNQQVRGLALDEDSHLWIATSEGAWKFTPSHTTPKGRRSEAENAGGTDENPENQGGDWVHFHTGNGLTSKNVIAVQTQGGDVWFLTDAGVECYHHAKSQVGFFYEGLLPVLNLTDLYHAYLGTTFPIEEWGTIGGFVNFVSFGQNLQSTTSSTAQSTFDAYEMVAALTYATRINKNAGIGVNAKFIYSALTQGVTSSGEKTNGVAASYAVDLGFLQKNLFSANGLSLGFVMQNMGPAVFYVDQAQSDPIPFTWRLGLGYELIHTPNHRLTLAADANREAFYRYGNTAAPVWIGAWKELIDPSGTENLGFQQTLDENLRRTVYNTGAEYVYANVVALRGGYLHDISGQRYEMDIGLGFMLSDILQIDGTFIKSFDNGIRNGQKRFSMILRF